MGESSFSFPKKFNCIMDDRRRATQDIATKRWRVSLILSGAMIIIYFGFILHDRI
jgi:uncharacterized membrane protein (DUF485 family)